MEDTVFLTGQMLLALPGISDPRFERAVIAICLHDEQGALGVGVGHELVGVGLHSLLTQFNIDPGVAPDAPVLFGGPVEPRRGFVLHTNDWSGQDTASVAGRWSLTTTVDVLRAIADGSGPSKWLVALGYAGWSEGQLDEELGRHGWFNVPGDAELLFDTVMDDRWEASFAKAGIDPRLLTNRSGRA